MLASSAVIAFIQSVFLSRGLGFSSRAVLSPWLQAGLISGATILLHGILCPVLESSRFFNLPLIMVTGMGALACSAVFSRPWKGASPAGQGR